MPLSYGTDGIKQKDWRVYVGLANTSGLQAAIGNYISAKTKSNLDTIIALLAELGECRRDSIEANIADGDSVEGNVMGKVVLNKTGSFTAELINSTPANIAALEVLDGQACTVVMYERDTHTQNGSGSYKTAELINNFVLSYSEAAKGGDSTRATVSMEKNVANPSAFRTLADISQT